MSVGRLVVMVVGLGLVCGCTLQGQLAAQQAQQFTVQAATLGTDVCAAVLAHDAQTLASLRAGLPPTPPVLPPTP